MPFKLGETLDDYGMTYTQLAKICKRSKRSVYEDAYRHGVKKRFTAMAYAYALQCDISRILETREPEKEEGWEQPCLPGCEL